MVDNKRPSRTKKAPQPLDQQALSAIAVRYVERFQTSEARLLHFLQRKLRERGWEDAFSPPDPYAIVRQMVSLGYVNDQAFAEARTRGLLRKGMGAGRVRSQLAAYGVDAVLADEALDGHDPVRSAIEFARRKRFGPFGKPHEDPKMRERQMAAMARAGHAPRLARAVISASSEEDLPEPEGD